MRVIAYVSARDQKRWSTCDRDVEPAVAGVFTSAVLVRRGGLAGVRVSVRPATQHVGTVSMAPIIAGNPGGVCAMVGEHEDPNVVAAAVQGLTYTFQNGEETQRFIKSSGTSTPGWVPYT